MIKEEAKIVLFEPNRKSKTNPKTLCKWIIKPLHYNTKHHQGSYNRWLENGGIKSHQKAGKCGDLKRY
ncbi:hypothetical protein B0A58_05355 [Flavobacterium branchiophilum NBRC 15030 = ATCC 35035]|uniref:hypothetical protein n=1 Tax=Flavobacterium branchiophilum TaxID=55197 RepID=UPI000B5BC46C|nr:hypothetical protein [Flavobacterium branchiophilum]OXA77618.1 hypothetical protein B0A58_05355 [Flavobacterium branchiophilum NBRC 15030 = ATCC 35035]